MRAILVMAGFLLLTGCAMQSAQTPAPTFEHLMFNADERIQARNFEAGRKLLVLRVFLGAAASGGEGRELAGQAHQLTEETLRV